MITLSFNFSVLSHDPIHLHSSLFADLEQHFIGFRTLPNSYYGEPIKHLYFCDEDIDVEDKVVLTNDFYIVKKKEFILLKHYVTMVSDEEALYLKMTYL